MIKPIWEEISDKNVRHIWKDTCSCYDREEIIIPPTFYECSGTPICPECGCDCEYVRTEINTNKSK